MFSVDLSTRECGGHVVVALRGELDIADAAALSRYLPPAMRAVPRMTSPDSSVSGWLWSRA
jgi:hypothetical protein